MVSVVLTTAPQLFQQVSSAHRKIKSSIFISQDVCSLSLNLLYSERWLVSEVV